LRIVVLSLAIYSNLHKCNYQLKINIRDSARLVLLIEMALKTRELGSSANRDERYSDRFIRHRAGKRKARRGRA